MAASEQWGDADTVGTFHFDLLEPKITGTNSVFSFFSFSNRELIGVHTKGKGFVSSG